MAALFGARVLLLLGLLAAALAFSPTWSLYSSATSSNNEGLGKTASLPGLTYVRALNASNVTFCSLVAFDKISYDGVDLGVPSDRVTGTCYTDLYVYFLSQQEVVAVGFHFFDTPVHGTNVTSVSVRQFPHGPKITFIPNRRLFAARKRCYDCAADLTFTNDHHNVTFHSLRLQAYLPGPNTAPATFSPRYPDSDCPTSPETGFDAALYFGIGIGILGFVGAALVVRHVIVRRRRTYSSGYQPINSSD